MFSIIDEMVGRGYLGSYELMVLLAVIRLGASAYGVTICRELETTVGQNAALGSVYAALDRLEAKGLIASRLGDPTPARGGRAKRYVRATANGIREARSMRDTLVTLWEGLPEARGVRS